VAILASVFAGSASAEGGGDHVEGNPTCADLGYDNGFKIEATGELPASGTYAVGDPGTEAVGDADGFEVAITVNEGDPATVDFEANTAVNAVIVKAGPGAKVYTYEEGATSGEGLESPKDSISHITFCWDGDTPPPDDEEPTPTTVPGDEEPTPTTVPGDAPDGEAPDDDEAPGTTPAAEPVAGTPSFTG
jgi:hypothetical protein